MLVNTQVDKLTEPVTDVSQTQVVLNLSISYQSLVELITKLGIRELIQLKRSLNLQINHALRKHLRIDSSKISQHFANQS